MFLIFQLRLSNMEAERCHEVVGILAHYILDTEIRIKGVWKTQFKSGKSNFVHNKK